MQLMIRGFAKRQPRVSLKPLNQNLTAMKTTQIKTGIASAILLFSGLAQAQIPLTVKTLDQDALLEGRAWRMVDAGTDSSNGLPYITYGQPACDVDRKAGTYTYNSVQWNFNKFFFDKELNYTHKEEKSFESSLASLDYAPIWGKTFVPMDGDMNISAGAVGVIASMAGASASLGAVDASFIGKNSVTVGMKGFTPTLAVVKVYSKVISGAAMTNKPTAAQLNSCWETPASTVVLSEPLKEVKGQKWYMQFSNPRPGGGHVFFATSGVINEPGKGHYIFRNYDENGAVIGEEVISFGYVPLTKTFALETDQPSKDYVIVSTSVNYKDKTGIPMGEPLFAEFIRVDGNTLKVKERFSFQLATSGWAVEKAIEKEGAVYLMGPASASTTERAEYLTYRTAKSYPNYQVAKIANGKAEYVNSISVADITSAIQQVPNIKGKATPSLLLTNNTSLKYWVFGGKIYVAGQQFEADKYGNATAFGTQVFAAIDEMGKLEAVYAKPETAISKSDVFFSKDKNIAYWATFDYKAYNTFTGAFISAKKYDFIAAELNLTKIDLKGKSIVSNQIFGSEEFSPIYDKELLFDSETHVAFNAQSLAKKAKDSDITLMMFEK